MDTKRVTFLMTVLLSALLMGVRGGEEAYAVPANEWKLVFYHNAGKSGVDFSKGRNAAALSELEGIASATAGRKLDKVEIRSYSSPEGSLSWNRKLAGLRSEKLSSLVGEKFPGQAPVIEVNNVDEDWASAETYLNNSDKAWKAEALQIIRLSGEERKEKLEDLWAGEAWDDLLWNCFSSVRRTEVILHFEPNSQFSEAQNADIPAEFSFKFPVGRTSVALSYMQNDAVSAALKSQMNAVGGVTNIYLDAYSSPEGRSSWNLELARRRAESVKAYLVSLGYSADRIIVRTRQENWSGLAEVLRDNWFGADRQEVLDIIEDSSISDDAREQKLCSLRGGAVWNSIIASWMSGLRCVNVSFE